MKARRMKNIRGAAMIEYVLLIGLIGAATIAQLSSLGLSVSNLFDGISRTLNSASKGIR